jgi:hypothetical protein
VRVRLTVAVAAVLGGCTPIVRYTDELVSARSGRTFLVRTPATFGGIVGFLAGVPVDIAALPVTWVVYTAQDEVTRDPLSIFLFPSFVLWRVGTLLGAPIDLVEWATWRWWQQEDALTPEERERREAELDELEWPDYPVDPLYPRDRGG